MLRQIKWWLQNGLIKKNGVLPVTTLFFENFVLVRTSFKELICCTNNPNTHICTFCKRRSFIWRSFFPVSILKNNYFVKHWWTAVFENHVYLNWTEKFPEFQSDDVNWKFIEQGMTYVVKIPSFYGDRIFVSSFLNFMKTSPNLTKVISRGAWPWHQRPKIRKITGKSGVKFLKFVLCVINQTVYRFSKI